MSNDNEIDVENNRRKYTNNTKKKKKKKGRDLHFIYIVDPSLPPP